jgi:hypothetical protein
MIIDEGPNTSKKSSFSLGVLPMGGEHFQSHCFKWGKKLLVIATLF